MDSTMLGQNVGFAIQLSASRMEGMTWQWSMNGVMVPGFSSDSFIVLRRCESIGWQWTRRGVRKRTWQALAGGAGGSGAYQRAEREQVSGDKGLTLLRVLVWLPRGEVAEEGGQLLRRLMELLAREAELLAVIISGRHAEEGVADGEKRLLVLLALLVMEEVRVALVHGGQVAWLDAVVEDVEEDVVQL